MKLAIQGDPTRGKEVIRILESLGGKTIFTVYGVDEHYCYYINPNGIIIKSLITIETKDKFSLYTLEEFERKFPFKIGETVITTLNHVGTIIGIVNNKYEVMFKEDSALIVPHRLKPYKEMKEERNITLTLDKAKEWYKKGGELKEIALQAFSEKELNPFPKSWEEFAENNARMGYYISADGKPLMCASSGKLSSPHVCPSKKSAEAHLAMIQLEQLRNCYNNNSEAWGWSYSIIKRSGIPELVRGCDHDTFLRFNNETVAKEFLKNFKNLIEKAGDLI